MRMRIHRFIKEEGQWFIDLPDYIEKGGSRYDLQMVDGADAMLDVMAGEEDDITISINITPFEKADKLVMVELCDPLMGGAYYLMEKYEGREVKQRMWLCAVTEYLFGYLPESIYVRKEC